MSKCLQGILVGIVSAGVALLLLSTGCLDGIESLTWQWRVRQLAAPSPSTPQIKLILLDQASLDWGKQVNRWGWPWPREALAGLIDFCTAAGARVFVTDVVLSEPSVSGVYDDEVLGDAIKRAGNVVSIVVLSGSAGERTTWPEHVPTPLSMEGSAVTDWISRAQGVVVDHATFPIHEVAQASAALGNVVKERDRDAVISRMPLVRIFDGQTIPVLGLAAFMVAENPGSVSISNGWLQVGTRRLPMDRSGQMILRYRGGKRVYSMFSAASVLQSHLRMLEGREPTVNPSEFKDAYVLYGYSAPALLDLRPTPMSTIAPGVSIHATILDNVLESDAISEIPSGQAAMLIIIPAIIAGGVVRRGRRALHTVIASCFLLPLPWLFSLVAYQRGAWAPVTAPTVGVALTLFTVIILNYATEGRARAFIKNAFQYYLSPDVIEQILADPNRLKLGGERREMSIFFSDLQGFSSIAESMDPRELTNLLNDYLSDMTSIILDENGTLDKYEGDAIMAFWNAPLNQTDHAIRACRAAIRCQRKLADRRKEFLRKTGHELFMQIGIHTGPVVVGNMGAHQRFDYTVLGDAANLASRLEGANKVFGTYIMVSESTWKAAQKTMDGRELGRIRVVGRKQPVRVFELRALANKDGQEDHLKFDEARELFEAGRINEAAAIFKEQTGDPVTGAYLERSREEVAETGADWDPVWNLTSK